MMAFAANSVLTRLALAEGAIGPVSFAVIRLGSGALALIVLMWWTGRRAQGDWRDNIAGAGSLLLYMLGFSFAYLWLDAGLGALILFGGVQITMFAGALVGGEVITKRRYLGAALSFAGLVYLLWPTAQSVSPSLPGSGLMALAAFGWGIYSLLGRKAGDPLAGTGMNFILATPVLVIVLAFWPDGVSVYGVVLALLCGVVTSAFGYALWYSVLPELGASRAAVSQLTVPIIAVFGGVVVLGEMLSLKLVLAALLVISGVLLSLSEQSAPRDRSA
ncbi:UNVERIFIED_CONTAM: hypothetical protein GTU68_022183 [Idotea baltica]|nr:hypothetical protein [Idotea baltica]